MGLMIIAARARALVSEDLAKKFSFKLCNAHALLRHFESLFGYFNSERPPNRLVVITEPVRRNEFVLEGKTLIFEVLCCKVTCKMRAFLVQGD